MFRIAVCDDCPIERELILSLLDKYKTQHSGLVVTAEGFQSGTELLSALDAGREFELFLLDILMPEMDGIELAKKLRRCRKNIPLVFLTTTPDYSLEAFGVWAVQYLLKPVTENMLFPVLNKISDSIEKLIKAEENCFVILTPESIVKTPINSIIYVENIKRIPHFSLNNGDVISAKSIRGSFVVYMEPLLNDNRFVCPHSSFVINLEHVAELIRYSFSMQNGIHVPIPRYRYAEMKSKYFSYLSKRSITGGIL